jgi:hypothetical protein
MPIFELFDNYKARRDRRREIERQLIAKGLNPRSLKFSEVLYRKLRARRRRRSCSGWVKTALA